MLSVFVLPFLLYIGGEVFHDALIIDPFTVPKSFEEEGLTPDAMANRIGDAMRQIETTTETRMKKDALGSLKDEGSVLDVEIPGTKLGLQAVVEITRAVFGIHPKHISGDIIVPLNADSQATVTFYVVRGRDRGPAVTIDAPVTDIGLLAQRTAARILEFINPYVLAAYRIGRGERLEAARIAQRIIEDTSEDPIHVSAAFNLLGLALDEQGKYDEAILDYQKAIRLDPRFALAYDNWGNALSDQKKWDEAIAKYRKALELDARSALAYDNWGSVLEEEQEYDQAVTKYQKATEIDPADATAYYNWGVVLQTEGKIEEAKRLFSKAQGLRTPRKPGVQ